MMSKAGETDEQDKREIPDWRRTVRVQKVHYFSLSYHYFIELFLLLSYHEES